MIYLKSVSLKGPPDQKADSSFPFSIPAIRSLRAIEFPSPVTFFVGENGSGKSTFMEALAIATKSIAVASESIEQDRTLDEQRILAARFKTTWSKRTHKGFFLRAEDFFGFAKRLSRERAELRERLRELDQEYRAKDRSELALGLASLPARSSLAEMTKRYGENLDANSHGESFLKLFSSRVVPGGLYLLDEPEAALSPQSQLGFIALVNEMVAEDSQFVIATHSPILLALPGAAIYSFDEVPVARVPYEELEHVNLTRAFLTNPERFLRLLGARD
ncbi:MAG: AAA family ATPase [Gemmatimonadaceae bacterium]